MGKTKVKRLTIRERKFIKGLAEGMSGAEAARQAGYSEGYAKQIGSRKLANVDFQASLQELMQDKGLTNDQVLNDLSEGLKATKVIGYLHNYKREEGKNDIEPISADEIISNEFLHTEDWGNRHKYLVTELELQGHIKQRTNGDQIVQISITIGELEAIRAKNDAARARGLLPASN